MVEKVIDRDFQHYIRRQYGLDISKLTEHSLFEQLDEADKVDRKSLSERKVNMDSIPAIKASSVRKTLNETLGVVKPNSGCGDNGDNVTIQLNSGQKVNCSRNKAQNMVSKGLGKIVGYGIEGTPGYRPITTAPRVESLFNEDLDQPEDVNCNPVFVKDIACLLPEDAEIKITCSDCENPDDDITPLFNGISQEIPQEIKDKQVTGISCDSGIVISVCCDLEHDTLDVDEENSEQLNNID